MSNVYIQEPPALGKVLLKTTVGDIDIELWTKETPKTCRNFIQLCMEGYYKGTIFHRVVSDFIVQGGDPNGDGTGGESVYGAPFKDEFHSRLRFNRRGLVAMANAGKDDNASQFFFTLNATPELQNKHTIFGKVTGETVFNMLKLAEGEIGPDERPVYPHKITSVEILTNPFEDIVPRVKLKAKEETEVPKKSKKDRSGVKNFGLLSFGMEAEEDEDEAIEFRGKPKSTHDLLEDPKLSKKTAAELELPDDVPHDGAQGSTEKPKEGETAAAVSSIREKLQAKKQPPVEEEKSDSGSEEEYYLGKDKDIERRKERDKIRNEIILLKKEMKKPKDGDLSSKDASEPPKPADKMDNELYKQYVEEQDKYSKLKEKIPKKGSARQDFTLALLAKFKNKLSAIREKSQSNDDVTSMKIDEESAKPDNDDDLDNDDWLGHKLHFEERGAVLAKDASTKGDDWFDMYDPRNPLNKRKREESDRKQREKMKKK